MRQLDDCRKYDAPYEEPKPFQKGAGKPRQINSSIHGRAWFTNNFFGSRHRLLTVVAKPQNTEIQKTCDGHGHKQPESTFLVSCFKIPPP